MDLRYNFNRMIGFALASLLISAYFFVGCDTDETVDPITITARLPETVVLKDTFSIADTLFFHIESLISLDSVKLFEGNRQFIGLNVKQVTTFDLTCFYNPASVGLKSLKLVVKGVGEDNTKEYPFTILVVEE